MPEETSTKHYKPDHIVTCPAMSSVSAEKQQGALYEATIQVAAGKHNPMSALRYAIVKHGFLLDFETDTWTEFWNLTQADREEIEIWARFWERIITNWAIQITDRLYKTIHAQAVLSKRRDCIWLDLTKEVK